MATTVDYILKVSADQAKAALKTLNQQTDKLGASFQNTMKKMGASMLKLSAGIAASGLVVVALGQKMADLANEMSDASTKTGLAIDTLQGLKLAAEGSGLQFSNLENGLIRFQSSITSAIEGTGAASDAFRDLGIDLFDSNGELKSADQLFRETTNALGAMESATLRNSKAIDLFGQRAGPALAQSGALGNMKAFADFASEFGINMQEASKDAADFQRGMAEIGTITEGLLADFLKIITGTNSLSDALFAVSDTLVFFGTIAREVFSGVRDVLKATGQIAFFNFANDVVRAMTAAKMALTGNIEGANAMTKAFALMSTGESLKSAKLLSEGIDKITGSAEKAHDRLKLLREQRAKILATEKEVIQEIGIGKGKEKGPAARDFSAVTGRMEKFSIELGQFTDDLFESTDKLLKGIENLPRLVEQAFRVSVAGVITESIIAGVSGPSGFLNTIGEAFDTLTMGLSSTIAGAIGGIARLGEKTPKEIQQDFQNFAKAFEKGLRMLPRVLIQVLPRFVVALIRGIGEALLKLPFLIADAFGEAFKRLWENIKEFFRDIFTREGRQERRQQRRERRRNFFKNLGESSQFFMSGGIMQAQSGARFTGAKRGLAMLHEGETVLPASGRAGQAEQRMMNKAGGGGINIVINSAVVENRAIDELVRKLETRFGQFGVGKSSLFGR